MALEGTEGRRKIHLVLLRTSPELKVRLEQSAESRGRSLTQEIESRLEGGFVVEELVGGATTATLLHRLGNEITEAEARNGGSWWQDQNTWTDIRQNFENTFLGSEGRPGSPHSIKKASEAKNTATVTVRCTSELKAQLDQAAALAGRSVNKEARERLARSVQAEIRRPDVRTLAFLHLLGAILREMEAFTGKSWHADADTRQVAWSAIKAELRKKRPLRPKAS